jgi:hypothetical protein
MNRPRELMGFGCLCAALVLSGCTRNRAFENWSPTIPGSHFKTIVTMAGSSERGAIRLMIQVREALQKAGVKAVRTSGRWDTIVAALGQLCGPGADQPVDGVLIVSYNHVVLYDCQTNKPAYEMQSAPERGGVGLDEMTRRLIGYLQKDKAPS